MTARELPPFELGHPRTTLRRKLVEAVLSGEKTATSSLLSDYDLEQEPLPRVGELSLLHDYEEQPVAVIETTEVRVLRAVDIDLAFARDEGEGFESVAEWRSAHETFWKESTITDETLIVAERFLVAERL